MRAPIRHALKRTSALIIQMVAAADAGKQTLLAMTGCCDAFKALSCSWSDQAVKGSRYVCSEGGGRFDSGGPLTATEWFTPWLAASVWQLRFVLMTGVVFLSSLLAPVQGLFLSEVAMNRKNLLFIPLVTLLGACSSENEGVSGGGSANARIDSFQVRGQQGSTTAPVVDTTMAAPFALLWSTQARNASNDSYRVEAELVGVSGDSRRFFQRNCGDIGIDSGCDRGSNDFPCTVDPNAGSPVLICPPGEDFARTNVNGFFAQNEGLPATYTVRFRVCVLNDQFDDVCDTAERSVSFR